MSQKKLVQVKDVMKARVDIVDGMSTVQQALEQMKHIDTKCLIVDKRHEHDEYGIVMIADIAKHVLAKDRAADRVNIYEIMSKPVIHVDADMDIRYCARLFDQFGLSRAPVIQNGELVGIVSFHDMVLRSMVNHD
jgi:predicted transcriptional regulator